MTDSTLPPLPEPEGYIDGTGIRYFDACGMTAYATTAVNEARAPLLAEIDRLKAQVEAEQASREHWRLEALGLRQQLGHSQQLVSDYRRRYE